MIASQCQLNGKGDRFAGGVGEGPTYCNVCREALTAVTSHGLSCDDKVGVI